MREIKNCKELTMTDTSLFGHLSTQDCMDVNIEGSVISRSIEELKNCETFDITDSTIFDSIMLLDSCDELTFQDSTIHNDIND